MSHDPANAVLHTRSPAASDDSLPPHLFPLATLRRGGVRIDTMEQLVFRRTLRWMAAAERLERDSRETAGELCRILEAVIGAARESVVVGELLDLRRTIHNDRMPKRHVSVDACAAIAAHASAAAAAQVARWVDRRRKRDRIATRGERAFAAEIEARRAAMKRLLRNRAFRSALLLASPTLAGELDRYVGTRQDSGRQLKLERAALRYYSRSALKLSPFSSFTRSVAVLFVAPDGHYTSVRERPGAYRVDRSMQLNKAFVATLADQVVQAQDAGPYLVAWMNPAVTMPDGRRAIVRREYRPQGPARLRIPGESLIRFQPSRAVDAVAAYIEAAGGCVRLAALRAHCGSAMGASEADAFIDRLVRLGVVIVGAPLREETNGARELSQFLADVPGRTPAAVVEGLAGLDGLLAGLARAPYHERRSFVQRLHVEAGQLVTRVGGSGAPHWNEHLFYEDCVERQPVTVPVAAGWHRAIDDLAEFTGACGTLLDFNVSMRATIRDVLRSAVPGRAIPVLALAQEVGRAIGPPVNSRSEQQPFHTPNPRGLKTLERLTEMRTTFFDRLCTPSDDESIDVRRVIGEFDTSALGLPLPTMWFSFYCQPLMRHGNHSLVVNAICDGPARSLVRVCGALPDGPQQAMLAELQRQIDARSTAEPIEIVASFDYNVNVHPRVTRRALAYLGTTPPGDRDLSLADLSIRLQDDRPVVIDERTGRAVAPRVFGMMMTNLAPPTLRLLDSIDGACVLLPKPFRVYRYPRPIKWGAIEHFPRLLFGRCVLRRRGWAIPERLLPRRSASESAYRYFTRVWKWRVEVGLPEEIFVYTRDWRRGDDAEGRGRRLWNRKKPQYVDFRNFWLVDIFSRILDETFAIYVEEMLPDSRDWAAAGMRRACELVVDVNRHAV